MQTSLRLLPFLSQLYNLRNFSHSQDRFWRDAAEIHLRSPIGACTYMRIYMNRAVLMRENVAEKKCICEKRIEIDVRLITTWFLITMWVISEHRKSCDRKTSAQSNQKVNATFSRSAETFILFYLVLYYSGMRNWTVWLYYCSAYRMIRGKSETCRRSLIR